MAPVGHVNRKSSAECLVMARMEKMQQFVQDDVVDAVLRGLEKILVEVDSMEVSAAATPQCPHS